MNYTQESDILQPKTVNSTKIFQFLVELDADNDGMPIWRTLEIPETYSFFDLHVAIQDSMTWSDVELHKFDMKNPITEGTDYIGIEDDLMCEPIVFEKNALIANYFSLTNSECTYMYDFVMPRTFHITLEKILPAIPHIKYPRCIGGHGLAPEVVEDGEIFVSDDTQFDLKDIKFRDPEAAWMDAFQGF